MSCCRFRPTLWQANHLIKTFGQFWKCPILEGLYDWLRKWKPMTIQSVTSPNYVGTTKTNHPSMNLVHSGWQRRRKMTVRRQKRLPLITWKDVLIHGIESVRFSCVQFSHQDLKEEWSSKLKEKLQVGRRMHAFATNTNWSNKYCICWARCYLFERG